MRYFQSEIKRLDQDGIASIKKMIKEDKIYYTNSTLEEEAIKELITLAAILCEIYGRDMEMEAIEIINEARSKS